MPLVDLLSDATTERELSAFAFAHARDHDEIDAALLAKRNVTSVKFPLDPIPMNKEQGLIWLELHQNKHNAMNNALGLTGTNMSLFDFSNPTDIAEFIGINFGEHQDARSALGI